MKKLFILLSTLALLVACSEEESVATNTLSDDSIRSSHTTKSLSNINTDTISEAAYEFGATRFVVNNNSIYYKSEGRQFYYLGKKYNQKLNLSDFVFVKSGDTLRISGKAAYMVTINGVDHFSLNSKPPITIDNASNGELDTPEIFLLSLVKYELSLLQPINNPGGQYTVVTTGYPPLDIGAACGLGDTYYCAGMGLTQAGATSDMTQNFNDAVAAGQYDGCTQIGLQEPGFLTGGLVQLMTFCCP